MEFCCSGVAWLSGWLNSMSWQDDEAWGALRRASRSLLEEVPWRSRVASVISLHQASPDYDFFRTTFSSKLFSNMPSEHQLIPLNARFGMHSSHILLENHSVEPKYPPYSMLCELTTRNPHLRSHESNDTCNYTHGINGPIK